MGKICLGKIILIKFKIINFLFQKFFYNFRNELEETRNRLLSASQKLSALKQMNEEITLELNRLRERIIVLEKV